MSAAPSHSLVWFVWPLRDRPGAGLCLLAAVLGLAMLAGLLGGDPSWGLLAAFLVLAWLHDFMLPTRFEVSGDGVVARGGLFTRRVSWRDASRLVVDERGGWIGRARGRRWRRRGVTLFWRGDRDLPSRLLELTASVAPSIERRDLRESSSGESQSVGVSS
ncbi:MAG: hypothetical protein ACO3QA_09445 [Phycisphaerales bacterium]|jgi:hypothetical protein